MQPGTHQAVTEMVFDIVREIHGDHFFLANKAVVAEQARSTDSFAELELVDVESFPTPGTGRDNPHADEWAVLSEDQARYRAWGYSVSAFNHFIDIRKAAGLFDDYDGYSYHRGSGKLNEYQTLDDYLRNDRSGEMWGLAGIAGSALAIARNTLGAEAKVDAALNWWFNDEYIHAPGQPWYRGCSPSVERYSYYSDQGTYPSVQAEAPARFPLAEWVGRAGKGLPYGVFMPLDNLARYWYNRFTSNRSEAHALGPVMHAIQDACMPHHAAGCVGNWHTRYERSVNENWFGWLNVDAVRNLVAGWDRIDPLPPTHLSPGDWGRTPARNWRIDHLVTWVAFHASKAFSEVDGYRAGWVWRPDSAANLFLIGTAMCAHVLRTVLRETRPPVPDACQPILDRMARIKARIRTAYYNLNKNLPPEQEAHWSAYLEENLAAQTAAEQELAACRQQHPQ